MRAPSFLLAIAAALGCAVASTRVVADGSDEDLAKKLSNPVAALISVPFQFNYDGEIGSRHSGDRATMNLQPVVPISLSADWHLISRTILPVVAQWSIAPGSGRQFGLGDVTQSLFFSPIKPLGGIVLGVGPVLVLPTGTEDLLSGGQWGAGPTVVALSQIGGWTVGVLANHIWSFAEARSNAASVSTTFVQPFLAHTTKDAWTYSFNIEATYDWNRKDLALPLNFSVSKVTKIGDQRVSFALGMRYWAESSDTGPEGFGARAVVTLLFPECRQAAR